MTEYLIKFSRKLFQEHVFMEKQDFRKDCHNVFQSIRCGQKKLTLHCPFCNAVECERVSAVDHEGKRLVLIMFDCPFSHRFDEEELGSDEILQSKLDVWRRRDGDSWLESLGPLIRERELHGIERFQKTLHKP